MHRTLDSFQATKQNVEDTTLNEGFLIANALFLAKLSRTIKRNQINCCNCSNLGVGKMFCFVVSGSTLGVVRPFCILLPVFLSV